MAIQGLTGCAIEGELGGSEPGEVGLGAAGGGGDVGVASEAILNGVATTSRPAIGQLSITRSDGSSGACTGTLISSQVVLTAAHCFGYNTNISGLGGGTTPPNNNFTAVTASFIVDNPSSTPSRRTHTVKRVYVIGNALGHGDLAVVQLTAEVPASFATPIQIATSTPPDGTVVQGFGYGCTYHGRTDAGTKRSRSAQWRNSTFNTVGALGCAGDSGGPVLDPSGRIIAVISGPTPQKLDLFANPVAHRNTIDRINAIYGKQQLCNSCPIVSFQTSNRRNFLQNASGVVNASATSTASAATQFRLIQFGRAVPQPNPVWVALQTSSGTFVTTSGGGAGSVKTSSTQIFNNELFLMESRSGGRSLRTNHVTPVFLTAANGGGGAVNSNSTTAVTEAVFF